MYLHRLFTNRREYLSQQDESRVGPSGTHDDDHNDVSSDDSCDPGDSNNLGREDEEESTDSSDNND